MPLFLPKPLFRPLHFPPLYFPSLHHPYFRQLQALLLLKLVLHK